MCRRPYLREPKTKTPPPAPVASGEEKRQALAQHEALEKSISTILHELKHGTLDLSRAQTKLAQAQTDVLGIGKYLSTTIEPEYYNEINASKSTATLRTFAVPELFDMILQHAAVPEILSFSQVSREMKVKLDNSSVLQRKLGLRAAPPDSNLELPFSSALAKAPGGGFQCRQPGRWSRMVGESSIRLSANFFPVGDGQKLPRIGSTYRRMFVTQPPIREMRISLNCCSFRPPNSDAVLQDHSMIISQEGITLGDLHDRHQKLLDEHRWCPKANRYTLNDSGQNVVGVQFTAANVPLCGDDPILCAATKKRKAEAETSEKRDRTLEWFKARQLALDAEQPFPTLHDWLHVEVNQNDLDDLVAAENKARTTSNDQLVIAADAFSFD